METVKETKVKKDMEWKIIKSDWIALFLMYIIGFSIASIIAGQYIMMFGIGMAAMIVLLIALLVELIWGMVRKKKSTDVDEENNQIKEDEVVNGSMAFDEDYEFDKVSDAKAEEEAVKTGFENKRTFK